MRPISEQASELQEQQQPQAELDQPEPTPAKIIVKITRGNLEAEIMLQHTSQNTIDPQMEDLTAALEENGIVYGVKSNLLHDLCHSPIYNRSFIIAAGKRPEVGKDGSLEFLIRTDRTLRPTIREDGIADYKDLGYIVTVEEGQPLCRIIPPDKGQDGMDVLGNVLEGVYGKPAPSPAGEGTAVSEDGGMLTAAVAGHAEVRKNVVSVHNVLKIKGNIDNSTGDVNFAGDVFIAGDVSSGFKVTSGSSIVIKGTVEGARLEAEGDVTISEGVNGMDRGVIITKGSVKARFLQNCFIQAEGSIYADTIMHCELECDGDVELSGKRGALIGGRTSIAGRLSAKALGTEMHTATLINMCAAGIAKKRELDELGKKVIALDSDLERLVQMLNRFEDLKNKNRLTAQHAPVIMQVRDSYIQLDKDRKYTAHKLEKAKADLLNTGAEHSFLECKGRINVGVRISFGPLAYVVQDGFVNSRIGAVGGEILISPL